MQDQPYRDPHYYRQAQYHYESRAYSALTAPNASLRPGPTPKSASDIGDVLAATDPWPRPPNAASGQWGYGVQPPQPLETHVQDPGTALPIDAGRRAPSSSYFGSDPLESFLAAKRQILARSARDVLDLIYDREDLHRDQMRRIDREESKVRTGLMEVEGRPVGTDPSFDRRRDTLEGHLLTLYRERRAQEVAAWRDKSGLREGLRTILGELEAEARKWSFVYGAGTRYG